MLQVGESALPLGKGMIHSKLNTVNSYGFQLETKSAYSILLH